MLNVIEYGKDEYDFPALIVLGCFDALHTGHRELLKKAKLQAKINGLDLGVMMFRDGKSGKLIYSFEERLAILEQFNVKFVLVIDFDDNFKKTAPLDFLKAVEDKINVKAYMSGKDFRFGAQAKGKSSTLKNYAEDDENGIWYMPIKDVDLNGEKISTTLIKTCLEEGDVVKANQLLGSEFSLTGEVVRGAGRGTSVVGFPTVNIVYPEWKHPLKHGVYSVKCLIGESDYQGVANFGTCPTFGDDRIALEVYFEGFSGDLYGQVLTIRFIDFVREIEEFASADELSGQIQSDLSSVSEEIVVADATVEEVEAECVEERHAVENIEVEACNEASIEEHPVEDVQTELTDEITSSDVADDTDNLDATVAVEPSPQEDEGLDETVSEVTEESTDDITVEEAAEISEEEITEEVVDETETIETTSGTETVVEETVDVVQEVSEDGQTMEETIADVISEKQAEYAESEEITENLNEENFDITEETADENSADNEEITVNGEGNVD